MDSFGRNDPDKFFMRKYFKIAQGLYKKANELGLSSNIIFWYKLKYLNDEGVLTKGNIVTCVRKVTNLSNSSIRRKIARLVDLGWIIDNDHQYNLISYDKLFSYFHYFLSCFMSLV